MPKWVWYDARWSPTVIHSGYGEYPEGLRVISVGCDSHSYALMTSRSRGGDQQWISCVMQRIYQVSNDDVKFILPVSEPAHLTSRWDENEGDFGSKLEMGAAWVRLAFEPDEVRTFVRVSLARGPFHMSPAHKSMIMRHREVLQRD